MQKFTFEFTIEELNIILQSLGKQPLELVLWLFNRMQKDIQQQQKSEPLPIEEPNV